MCHTVCAPQKLQNKCIAKSLCNLGDLVTLTEDLEGGAVALWLVRSTPEQVVRVQALARGIVLCSWARHFTLTELLSTQVYKWVRRRNAGDNPAMD